VNTKDKIITATIDLLSEKGFHGTRIKEVLERSKISKGCLYYYFPEGKKQLCKECLKFYTIKLSLEYEKLFTNANNLENGLRKIIRYTKDEIEQSKYTTGSLLVNVSQEIDSEHREIQKLCEKLFELIITAVESFFYKYNVLTWKQSARNFVSKLNGAIVLSKACKTTIFLEDLKKQYPEF